MSGRAGVVIPAAGAGRRLGHRPKALLELAGRPMLQWTLSPFLAHPGIARIVVALSGGDLAAPPAWLLALAPRVRIVGGGAERGDSVHAGLSGLDPEIDAVLVHDAARPLVSAAIIERVLEAVRQGRCVVAAIPAADTIQEVEADGRIVATPDRGRLWLAQTPQAFPRAVLAAAYQQAERERFLATDDAALVSRYGSDVHVVEGERRNFKITVPSDIPMAEALLSAP